MKKNKPAHPRRARPELRWLQGSWAQPRTGRCSFSEQGRLEPQVFSQEHGENAAQVVDRGWVKVGLRVIRRVPDRGEGHGDEVEHWDTCRGKRGLSQVHS